MNNIFNTTLENSLRILLILNADMQTPKNADMISLIDFISTYCKTLGVGMSNLHGENPFGFCEYTTRREKIIIALKELVVRGLITVEHQINGFGYRISASGKSVVEKLDTDYLKDYVAAINSTIMFTNDKTERQLMTYITEKTTHKLGGSNE